MNKDFLKEKISFYKTGLTYIVTTILLLGGSLANILFFHTNLLENNYKAALLISGVIIELFMLLCGALLVKKIRTLIKEL